MMTRKRTIGLLLIACLLTVGIASVYAGGNPFDRLDATFEEVKADLANLWSVVTGEGGLETRVGALEAEIARLETMIESIPAGPQGEQGPPGECSCPITLEEYQALEARVAALEQTQECVSGETRVCGSDVGVCVSGIETCVDNAWSGICEGGVGPLEENCDGLDNDCDGEVDEDLTRLCPLQLGVCNGATQTCELGSWSTCDYGVDYEEGTELSCDCLDNNCDGFSDEGNPGGGLDCDTGQPGICADGITQCVPCGGLECDRINDPVPEVCDGLDNNCDGITDEGDPAVICPPGSHVSTTACQLGDCTIVSCNLGWSDIDGFYDNGCECQADLSETNDNCATYTDIGTLTDTAGERVYFTANIVPSSDIDWYRFLAEDGSDPSEESFYVTIRLTINPDNKYRYEVYKGSCSNFVYMGDHYDEAGTLSVDDTAYYYFKVFRSIGDPDCYSYTLEVTNGVVVVEP